MAATASDKKINGMSSEAVAAKTGKTWPQWIKVLDAAGAKKLNHKGIVRILSEKYDVGPWWQQMVTVGYEKARGLRATHERPDGYSISASKTIGVPAETLFQAWTDPKRRKTWLSDSIEIRKATTNKSIRITWLKDKTPVEAMFYPKSANKCQVSVQHNRLPTASVAEKVKKFWKSRLEKLESRLT